MIDIVSASRYSGLDFWNQSALGLSLVRLSADRRIHPLISYENERALPLVYNEALESYSLSEYIVFIHDDVWIDDYFFTRRIIEGLQNFDVIGVAGNKRRSPDQPSWCFVGKKLEWDAPENLSGAIACGEEPCSPVWFIGDTPAQCELLDGVLLAARRRTLYDAGIRFDPQFDFHFYDLDFCRSARAQGLRLGTWPISLTHQSKGAFGSRHWAEKYNSYLEKWGD